jgi:ABC-2 type transport system ATP-binding protein
MNETTALEAQGLTKRRGRHTVLDDVTFSAPAGSVTALLGPRGSGRSTTLRLFAGLERPSAGRALVGGRPVTEWPEPGRVVGAALSARCAHPGRTALDGLRWIALLLGEPERACRDALDRVGLGAVAERRTGEFSLGMRQRLAVAQALLGTPEVLLLDEPMNGLDRAGIAWFGGLLAELRAEGRTVLVASRLLSEVEDLADDLVLLHGGRVVGAGSTAELRERFRREAVTVRCADVHRLAVAVREAGGHPWGAVHHDRVTVVGLDAAEVEGIAHDRGVAVEAVSLGVPAGVPAGSDPVARPTARVAS